MTDRQTIDAAIAARIRAADNATTGWIAGVVLALLGLANGFALREFDAPNPAGPILIVAGIAVVPLMVLLVYYANRKIARHVERVVTSGARRFGKIVLARRRSMTQARVIIHGPGIPSFEELIATPLSDAVLFGRDVDVYLDPIGGAPLLIPPQ